PANPVTQPPDAAHSIFPPESRPLLHSREGCSFSCTKPGVLVTIPGVVPLVESPRRVFSPHAIAALAARATAYVEQLNGRSFNDRCDERIPCPLLVGDRCSAYDVRPLVCRGYNSTCVDACREASHHSTASVPIFAMLKDVTDGATVGVAQCLDANGLGDAVLDLGTALHLAFVEDIPLADAALNDPGRLSAAADTAFVRQIWDAVRGMAREVGV